MTSVNSWDHSVFVPYITFRGIYHVTISFKNFLKSLQDYVKDYDLDLDPDFQRGLVWTTNQKSNYILHILRGGMTGKDFLFNCPNWDSCPTGRMVLVDGKQRANAISEFFEDKFRVNGCLASEINFRGQEPSVSFYVHSLDTKEKVLQWYLDMNSGGTPHTKEELEKVRRMLKGEANMVTRKVVP
jgi:hypothetical protein